MCGPLGGAAMLSVLEVHMTGKRRMTSVWGFRGAICGAWLAFAMAGSAASAEPVRMLFLTQSRGFVHASVKRDTGALSPAEIAVTELATEHPELFTVTCSQDAERDFTRETLSEYDVVMLYTSGVLPIAAADRDYFSQVWLKQAGHGLVGVHSALDTYRSKGVDDPENEAFRWYWEIIGGSFNGHPWTQNSTVTISVHEPDHPVMEPFGSELVIQDEIYQYFNWHPEQVRVLMSLDMTRCDPRRGYHVPVAWVRNWGDGRIYVNNLGHRPETWTNPQFLASLRQGIRWVSGEIAGAAEPNPTVSSEESRKARAAAPPTKPSPSPSHGEG